MSDRLTTAETNDLLKVVTDYTYALDVLDKYDHQVLEIEDTTAAEFFQITYEEAIKGHSWTCAISSVAAPCLETKKTESFQGSLAAIYQTFNGQFLYPSIEEKAANLLYFVIKESFLFRWQ